MIMSLVTYHLIEKSIVVTDSLAEHLEIKIIIETK